MTNIIENAIEKAMNEINTTEAYNENALINVYVANLAAYNDGYLMGKWVSLPISENELEKVFKEIQGPYFELEYTIHDYECFVSGISIDEYTSIDTLNEIAGELENLDEFEIEKIAAYIEVYGGDIKNALENMDRCEYYGGVTLVEYAEQLVDECYNLDEFAKTYFDYERFARDLSYDGYYETSDGVLYIG